MRWNSCGRTLAFPSHALISAVRSAFLCLCELTRQSSPWLSMNEIPSRRKPSLSQYRDSSRVRLPTDCPYGVREWVRVMARLAPLRERGRGSSVDTCRDTRAAHRKSKDPSPSPAKNLYIEFGCCALPRATEFRHLKA